MTENYEKDFVPHKQALALKKLGFDKPCLGYYIELRNPVEGLLKIGLDNDYLQAPLYQQAFRWFREKYKLLGTPQYFTGGFYCYTINDMKDTKKSNRLFTEFESFEEAELACISKLIEIVKQQTYATTN
jgi:hypothetical protein